MSDSGEYDHAGRPAPLGAILAAHAARYPLMQVQDLYKLIYQGVMGCEHAMVDADHAREWLSREVEAMGVGPDEPVLDPISAGGRIIRVHLRPYLAAGGDLESSLAAFIRTAEVFHGTAAELQSAWALAERMAEAGELRFPAAELRAFFTRMEGENYPAAHHSAAYRQSYRPAYRVILRKILFPSCRV